MAHEGSSKVLDHMQVLGLSTDATSDDVKKAYKRLALQFHPDKVLTDASTHKKIFVGYIGYSLTNLKICMLKLNHSPDDPEATIKFQELSVAYCSLVKKGENEKFCKYQPDDKGDNQQEKNDFPCEMEAFKRIFLDCIGEFFFKRKKHPPSDKLSTDEEEENLFFEYLCNNSKFEDSVDDRILTVDLKKFNNYEEWKKSCNCNSEKHTISDKNSSNANKKQDKKKKKKGRGDKNQKKISTNDSKDLSPQHKTEIEQQLKEARQREAELLNKINQMEAEERKEQKKSNRRVKKAAKKHSSQGGMSPINLDGDFYCYPTTWNSPGRHVEEATGRKPGIISNDDKEMRDDHLKDLLSQTNKQRDLCTEQHKDTVACDSRCLDMEYTSRITQTKITGSKKSPVYSAVSPKSELLQQHWKAYHELLEIQPERHTEKQILEENQRMREQALHKQETEFHRLGEETCIINEVPLDFGQTRTEYILKQRELEFWRNRDEALAIEQEREMRNQAKYDRTRNKSAPQIKVHHQQPKLMPKFDNPIKRDVHPGGSGVRADLNNPWVERQNKRVAVKQLIPHSPDEEEAMIRAAVELSRLTAQKEETTRKWWESVDDEEIDQQMIRTYSQKTHQCEPCDISYLHEDHMLFKRARNQSSPGKETMSSFGGARPKISSSDQIFTFRERCNNRNRTDTKNTKKKTQPVNKKVFHEIESCSEWDDEIAWKLEGPSFPGASPRVKTHLQNDVPKTHLQHDVPKTHLQHDVPKTHLQHDVPKTHLQHDVPKTQLQHDVPKTHLQHDVPKTHLQHEVAKTHLHNFVSSSIPRPDVSIQMVETCDKKNSLLFEDRGDEKTAVKHVFDVGSMKNREVRREAIKQDEYLKKSNTQMFSNWNKTNVKISQQTKMNDNSFSYKAKTNVSVRENLPHTARQVHEYENQKRKSLENIKPLDSNENWDDSLLEVQFNDLDMSCGDLNSKLIRPEGSGRRTTYVPPSIPRMPFCNVKTEAAPSKLKLNTNIQTIQNISTGVSSTDPEIHDIDTVPMNQETVDINSLERDAGIPVESVSTENVSMASSVTGNLTVPRDNTSAADVCLNQSEVCDAGNTTAGSVPPVNAIPVGLPPYLIQSYLHYLTLLGNPQSTVPNPNDASTTHAANAMMQNSTGFSMPGTSMQNVNGQNLPLPSVPLATGQEQKPFDVHAMLQAPMINPLLFPYSLLQPPAQPAQSSQEGDTVLGPVSSNTVSSSDNLAFPGPVSNSTIPTSVNFAFPDSASLSSIPWPCSSSCPPVLAYSLQQTEQMRSKTGQAVVENKRQEISVGQDRSDATLTAQGESSVTADVRNDNQTQNVPQKVKPFKLWQSSKHKKHLPSKLERKMELNRKVKTFLQEIRKTEIVNSEDRGSS